MNPHDPSEVLRGRRDSAGLRQPHEEVEANEGIWSHLVEVDAVLSEDVDNGGVERESKLGREKVLEYHHFVVVGLRVHLRLWGNSSEARRNHTSLLHVFQYGWRHLCRTQEGRGRSFSLL